MVRAIVFDFDGVLLDTETPELRAWSEMFSRYGCRLNETEWASFVGSVQFNAYAALLDSATLPVDSEAEIRASLDAHLAELLKDLPALPGVVDWLDEAQRVGLTVGLASNSEVALVERHLCRLGLRDRFVALACGGSAAPKPAPDLYLAACKQLGVKPQQAVAVEDSPYGVAAARAAGLFCVAVVSDLTSGLNFAGADVVLTSLRDASLGQILRRASPAC